MADFIINNWGTIVVFFILAAAALAAVRKILKDRNKCRGCGNGCSECQRYKNCRRNGPGR